MPHLRTLFIALALLCCAFFRKRRLSRMVAERRGRFDEAAGLRAQARVEL